MKTCTKCKESKDEAEFTNDKRKKDGLNIYCKACIRACQQTDAFKEYQRAYQHTDAFKEYQKAYRQTDAFKASQKAYRLRKKAAAAGNTAPSSGTQTMVAQG